MESDRIAHLTPQIEKRIRKNPLLNLDTFIVPSPYIRDLDVEKDYEHSYVWLNEGEILGYVLVYSDKAKKNFHLYKIVTSPFGRGMGVGTGFLDHLLKKIPAKSTVYLYVWEKLYETIEFFKGKGFTVGEQIVFRNLIYYYLSASCETVLKKLKQDTHKIKIEVEEIGKTRHDARKTLRILSNLVEMITVDNCSKIIEDINRETTSLVNMLNSFRDSMQVMHGVNLRELILERIVPFIKASPISCDLQINLNTDSPSVLGYHINISRALVNLLSNSLDAIEESGKKGKIIITLEEKNERIVLTLKDNGIGIDPILLKKGKNGLPGFVGNTTKGHKTGEGMGTRQIYSTFGKKNIQVRSSQGKGSIWKISFEKSSSSSDLPYHRLERRFSEFKNLGEEHSISHYSRRSEVISYIWRLRKMEILMFDIILQFSTYHNIRSIYGTILNYLRGTMQEEQLKDIIQGYRTDQEILKTWLFGMTVRIKERLVLLHNTIDTAFYRKALFKSYGQAIENIIIFTMDPESGKFLATDRKLAEHLDLVPYLDKPKDQLLRGEFKGDINDDSRPIFLGVWSIESEEDLHQKLKFMQKGASMLINIGLHPEKKLSFYQTTYMKWENDIDTYQTTTLGRFSELEFEGLKNYIKPVDDEIQDFIVSKD